MILWPLLFCTAAATLGRRMYGGRRYTSQVGFIAAIFLDFKHHCTGTAVREYWVLTAAHCIQSPKGRYRVQMGSLDDVNSPEFQVKAIVGHRKFTKTPFYKNDIALIKLQAHSPWEYGFLDLDTGFEYDLRKLAVFGWGDKSLKGVITYAKAPKASGLGCYKTYGGRFNLESELCAGSSQVSGGPCFKDSGAPLVAKANKSLIVVGVVSRGRKCHEYHPPNIFSNVYFHSPWIQSVFNLYPN
ncbi:hypothetical protein DSO57_1007574 [Entomophthora muscae]|uniref:Uncharacterized protein n=1 Tax=Entomophthora muscae TaxID=34485 RepID=A0ACC2S978_9FUNG|nr:hypothetical protein DSO57_1007574 [Entomophthora muscae]